MRSLLPGPLFTEKIKATEAKFQAGRCCWPTAVPPRGPAAARAHSGQKLKASHRPPSFASSASPGPSPSVVPHQLPPQGPSTHRPLLSPAWQAPPQPPLAPPHLLRDLRPSVTSPTPPCSPSLYSASLLLFFSGAYRWSPFRKLKPRWQRFCLLFTASLIRVTCRT